VNSFGFHARLIDHKMKLVNFGEKACHRCGSSVAFFLRKTAEVGLTGWMKHFVQLSAMYKVDRFEQFMLTIGNNLLRESI